MQLLSKRMYQCVPLVGKSWKDELHWIYLILLCTRKWEDLFLNGIRRPKMQYKGIWIEKTELYRGMTEATTHIELNVLINKWP